MVLRTSVTLSELQNRLVDNPLNHLALPPPPAGSTHGLVSWFPSYAGRWGRKGPPQRKTGQWLDERDQVPWRAEQTRSCSRCWPSSCVCFTIPPPAPTKELEVLQGWGPGIGSGRGTGSPQQKETGTFGLHWLGYELGSDTAPRCVPRLWIRPRRNQDGECRAGVGVSNSSNW